MSIHPSVRLASVVVGTLVDCGVKDVVLSPGSRSAGLALALSQAERAGLIRLHVRVDERGAGYLALGLAKVSGIPVAVVCTSGTAVANLTPAIVESSYVGVPVVAITADRPPRLRNTGSNQTIDQVGFFGRNVVHSIEFQPAVSGEETERTKWRRQVAQGLAAARSSGPVHMNIGFDVPLLATEQDDALTSSDLNVALESELELMAAGLTPISQPAREPLNDIWVELGRAETPSRGIVIVGDESRDEFVSQARTLARQCGWPLISEPSGNCAESENFIANPSVVLSDLDFFGSHVPELVVTVGKVGISRPVLELINAAEVHIAVDTLGRDRPDPVKSVHKVVQGVPSPPVARDGSSVEAIASTWLGEWQEASSGARDRLLKIVEARDNSSLALTSAILNSTSPEDLLFVAASRPVRDFDLIQERSRIPRIIGNRGASGIDGLVSTSIGASIAWQDQHPDARTFAVLGDLSALHDINAFMFPKVENQPRLTIIIIDNNGGAIFSGLEQGDPRFEEDFERVFGTPHDIDLVQVIAGFGCEVSVAESRAELASAITESRSKNGMNVILARALDRNEEQELRNSQKL